MNINIFLWLATFKIFGTIALNLNSSTIDHEISNIETLLKVISSEENYKGIILVTANNYCPFYDSEVLKNFPVILTSLKHINDFRYVEKFSKQSLIIICAQNLADFSNILQSKLLQQLSQLKYLIYIALSSTIEIQQFCIKSFEHDVYNAVILSKNHLKNGNLFSCRKSTAGRLSYELFRIEQLHKPVYENQFLNMHQDTINTYPDKMAPRSMLLQQPGSGRNFKLLGYVAKLVATFAERRNATLELKEPTQKTGELKLDWFQNATAVGILDIGIVLLSTVRAHTSDWSYPYEMGKVCYMIPLPQPVPRNYIFFYIVGPTFMAAIILLYFYSNFLLFFDFKHQEDTFCKWLQLFFNDRTLRGILGQPFPFDSISTSWRSKFLFLQLCYASLLFNTAYHSHLGSMLTKPPLQPLITDAASLKAANMKILSAYDFLSEKTHPGRTIPELFHILDNSTQFFQILDSMDTTYVYPVFQSRWSVFQEQQKYFQRKLFYMSENFCAIPQSMLRLPIRPRLPYRDLFDYFILRAFDSGLYKHWTQENYYDMLSLKITSIKDKSKDNSFGKALKLSNYHLIVVAYVGCLALSFFVLSLEYFVSKLRKKN